MKAEELFSLVERTVAQHAQVGDAHRHLIDLSADDSRGGILFRNDIVLDCRAAAFAVFNHVIALHRALDPSVHLHIPYSVSSNDEYSERCHEQYMEARRLLSRPESYTRCKRTKFILEYVAFKDLHEHVLGNERDKIKLPGVQLTCWGWWLFRLPDRLDRNIVPDTLRDEASFAGGGSRAALYMGFGEQGWKVYTFRRVQEILFETWEKQSDAFIQAHESSPARTELQSQSLRLLKLYQRMGTVRKVSIQIMRQSSAALFGVSL